MVPPVLVFSTFKQEGVVACLFELRDDVQQAHMTTRTCSHSSAWMQTQ
jgi:hypothetical protein